MRFRRHPLLVPGHDNSNTTSRNIPETDVESAELVADDNEHAKGLLRVLRLGQEVWCETEGKRHFRGLVEVRLQHMPNTKFSV